MEERRGVRVPPELQSVQPRPLEEYARARILQFAQAFAARLNPTVGPAVVQQAAMECITTLPPPDYSGVSLEQRDLQLVFRHDCLSLGCLDAQCVLCEHNPHRRCSVNFSPKYLVNDVLKAKCDAPIRVELIDRGSGQPISEDLPDVVLEMCVLDGNAYDQKVVEAGEERDDDLEACALLLNNKAQALLQAGPGATHNANSKVQMSLSKGVAVLPELHVSDSSEAMLSGRKPPFRLLVKAVHLRGQPINIRHAVSEGFVVATRRTRTAGKVEIPNVDDHISKLEHMGKETVKKLQDLRGSAAGAGIELSVPDNCINKVGEFRKLALLAEADGHLRQKLQQVLKLSKEKWEEARDHAMRAVVADNRMRIWYADKANMEVGLLFTCRLGDVDLDRPVGLLTKKAQEGAQTTMEATLMAQQTPAQRDQVRALQPQAVAAWWQQGHPGWAIYPVDSEQFLTTGALDSVSLPMPSDPVLAAPPVGAGAPPVGPAPAFPPPPAPSPPVMGAGLGGPPPSLPNAAAAAGLNPALASAFMNAGGGSMNQDALLRAMSPFLHGGPMPAGLAAMHPLMMGGAGGAPPSGLSGLPPHLLGGSSAAQPGRDSPQGMGAPQSAFAAAAQASAPQLNGPSAAGSGGSGGAGHTPFANAANLMPPPPPVTKPGDGGGSGGPGIPLSGPQGSAPSFNLAGLSGLLGTDLSRLPQLAGLANFPSLPPGMMSGDLEQLLTQTSLLNPEGAAGLLAGAARAPSFNIGKLESLNLPDEVMAAALMQMERAGTGVGASLPLPRDPSLQPGAAAAASLAAAANAAAAGQDGEQQQQQQQQQQGNPAAGEKQGGEGGGDAGNHVQKEAQREDGATREPSPAAPAVAAGGGGGGQQLTPQKRKA